MGQDQPEEAGQLSGVDEEAGGLTDEHAIRDEHERRADAEDDAGRVRQERHPDVVDEDRRGELGRSFARVVVLEVLVDVGLGNGRRDRGTNVVGQPDPQGGDDGGHQEQQRGDADVTADVPERGGKRFANEGGDRPSAAFGLAVQGARRVSEQASEASVEVTVGGLRSQLRQVRRCSLVQVEELGPLGRVHALGLAPHTRRQFVEAQPALFVLPDEAIDVRDARQSSAQARVEIAGLVR